MESVDPTSFAALLTAAIHQIKRREGKSVRVVQDELGYALGKAGGSVVEFWRKGNLPAKQKDLETLVRLLVVRGRMERTWLEDLLAAAGYGLGAAALCDELYAPIGSPISANSPVFPLYVAPAPSPFQAPALTPHFVGRNAELAVLRSVLSEPGATNVLALVGMGGVGKSTLAAQAAHAMRAAFPDGVLWVFAADAEPMDILQHWAQLFGYDFRGIADMENRAAAVRGLWQGRRVLIVLDDVRAPERLRPLLPGNAGAATLITTRDRDLAALANARIVELPELQGTQSLALLGAIIGHVRVASETDAAAAIAAIVGHLPLALEIVARLLARAPWQSLAEMAARLMNATKRLDRLTLKDLSVRAAFAVSWATLTPDLQAVFAALGLMQARPCAVAALAATAGVTLEEAMETLPALIALSLVQMDGTERVRQHPLLADFAREQLADPAASVRWVNYFLDFAIQHCAMSELIDAEMENLTAVLDTLQTQRAWVKVGQLVDALYPTWQARANYAHARRGYGWALAAARVLDDDHALAQTLIRLGTVCYELSDYPASEAYLAEGLAVALVIRSPVLAAEARLQLAHLARERGELEEADDLLLDALTARQDAGDELGVARVVRERAFLAYRQGDYPMAARLCHHALAVQVQLGDAPGQLGTIRLLADTAISTCDLKQAAAYAERALLLATQAGLLAETAEAQLTLAAVHRMNMALPAAYAAVVQADSLFRRIGNRSFLAYTQYEQSVILALDGREAEALALAQQTCDLQHELGDRYGQITTLLHLGDLHRQLGAPATALECWHEGVNLALAIRYPYIELLHNRIAQISE